MIVAKQRPEAGRLVAWLSNPANFARAFIVPDGEPLCLDPWQESFLASPSRFTVVLKSRRVGGSWAMAARMFARSQTIRRYGGVFVSMNREEARGKIDYADEFHEALPLKWRLRRVARSKDEIAFESAYGGRAALRSLAAKAPRGRGGDVGISELPHCQNAKGIYEGALHVTARSMDHQLTVESTPLGKGGVFHDICRGRYTDFTRYEVPWWLCRALCADVARAAAEAPAMATAQRVKKFGSPALKTIYASMPETAFRQESELEFCETANAAFSMELLIACSEPEFSDSAQSALAYRRIERIPTAADWAWLARNRRGTLTAGYDPARRNDRAALAVLDGTGERYETRMTVSMRDVPFAAQKEVIDAAVGAGVSKLRIDATGLGMDMAERLSRQWPQVVEEQPFTAKSKQMMVAGVYHALTDRRIVIPADRDLLAQMGSLREEVTETGAVVYRSRAGAAGHADTAWALIMAHEAARGVCGEAPVTYESLGRRKDMWNISERT